jgi:serine/threonine protein kinase
VSSFFLNSRQAVDMWSLGVVLFILLSGRPPWDDSNFGHLCETVLSGVVVFPIERWDGVSAIARDLCQRLMTRDPLARVTVDEALLHPWVTGAQAGEELEQAVTLSPPPRNHVKNREFAIPSSKKKPRPSDRDEQRKENAVLRLIQERESNGPALSPDLARCSVSSAETTPLLPPSSPLVFEEDPAGASPIARKLGFEFETPEKVKRPKMQLE